MKVSQKKGMKKWEVLVMIQEEKVRARAETPIVPRQSGIVIMSEGLEIDNTLMLINMDGHI